jgi:tetratricopeptide (TPR) repeat protein
MNESRADSYLNLYNPASLSAEQLLAEFLDRNGLLERILDIIRQNTPDKPQQHLIVIGSRGMGKTMLLCAIHHRVHSDAALDVEWLPIGFHEEQYGIGDLADFWLEAIRHLEAALERPAQAADELLDQPGENLAERAKARFFELLATSGRRGLLLIDNLNDVFAAIQAEESLHKLRALLMEDSRLMLIGTAASYFTEITDVGQPFHDFFRTFTLERLNQEELEAVLRRLAEVNQDSTVPEIIEKSPERVRSLRILTGGNPRLAKLGYRILKEGLDSDVRRDLERLLDECTPFFKHRIETLAKEGRRVFDAIARRWDPVTVDDLKKELRKPSNYISAQIKRLIAEGFVEEAGGSEKKKRYQVTERFYNIYYLMRYSREGREKLRWLVAFMRVFYTRRDYRDWSKRLEQELTSSLAPARREEKLGHLYTLAAAADDLSDRRDTFKVIVCHAIVENDHRCIEKAVEGDPIECFGWWYLVAELLWLLDRETRQRIGFNPSDSDWLRRLARILRERDLLRPAEEWIAEFGVFQLDTARRANVAGVMLGGIFNRLDEAEAAFRRALDLDPQVASAWNGLGNALADQGRYAEAETAYHRAIDFDPQLTCAWKNLGGALAYQGRYAEAEVNHRRALDLDPQFTDTWNGLGLALWGQRRYAEAEAAYREGIRLNPDNGIAQANLAGLYLENLDRPQEGAQPLLHGIELDPDYRYAQGLFNKHWRIVLPVFAARIAGAPENDHLREFVLNQLIGRIRQGGHRRRVLEALLALDEPLQQPFEPLILALQALKDRAILYGIAREKRDLVLDVMAQIGGGVDDTEGRGC